jgi:mycothiol synthase
VSIWHEKKLYHSRVIDTISLKMMTVKQSSYTVRSYRTADFAAYASLLAKDCKIEPGTSSAFMTHLKEELLRPNHTPQKDLFLVECAGRVIACLDITREIEIGRVILCFQVHPAHHRHSLTAKLLAHARDRIQETGARIAHIRTRRDDHAALATLDRLGFRPVRYFIHLRINLSAWPVPRMKPKDQIRPLRPGEEEKLTYLQNRSFAGSWGFCPNSTEEIIYRTHLSRCAPEDIILGCDEGLPVAYCWTKQESKYIKAKRTGQILMLGVDPAYRGRGWGRKVLIAGLCHLKGKNLSLVELTADSENRIASELYNSIGFEVFAHSVWHEKAISDL